MYALGSLCKYSVPYPWAQLTQSLLLALGFCQQHAALVFLRVSESCSQPLSEIMIVTGSAVFQQFWP